MAKTKELTIVNPKDYSVVKAKINITDIIEANLGGEQLTPQDLEKISIPSGAVKSWEIETLEGEETVSSIDGIIVHMVLSRVYWEKPFEDTGGGEPPDCVADDAQQGIGNPGGRCLDCGFSKFGSHRNERAQACQMRRFIFLVREDSYLPYVVSTPPSSLKNIKKYILRLSSRGLLFNQLVTSLTLTPDQNKDGVKYSKVNFNPAKQNGKMIMVDDPQFWKDYTESLKASFVGVAKEMLRRRDDDDDPGAGEPGSDD